MSATSLISSLSTPTVPYQFKSVRHNPERLEVVKNVFQRIIAPLYGPQDACLQKIENGTDRKCRLLYEANRPVGLVCYKTDPTHEFSSLGIPNSYEIKTLTLIHPEQDSGKGLGSQLLTKIEQSAQKAHAQWMHVTVSENKPESLRFFEKNGFTRVKEFPGLYQPGVTEFLLKKQLPQIDAPQALSRPIPTSTPNPLLATPKTLRSIFSPPEHQEESVNKKRKLDLTENWGQSTWGVEPIRSSVPSFSPPTKKSERIHQVPLRKQYLELIRSGHKTVEGRIDNGAFKSMKVGDKICFFCNNQNVTRTIQSINRYSSFEKMLQTEGVAACLPGTRSVKEGVAIYHAIPNYQNRAHHSGVVALKLMP